MDPTTAGVWFFGNLSCFPFWIWEHNQRCLFLSFISLLLQHAALRDSYQCAPDGLKLCDRRVHLSCSLNVVVGEHTQLLIYLVAYAHIDVWSLVSKSVSMVNSWYSMYTICMLNVVFDCVWIVLHVNCNHSFDVGHNRRRYTYVCMCESCALTEKNRYSA